MPEPKRIKIKVPISSAFDKLESNQTMIQMAKMGTNNPPGILNPSRSGVFDERFRSFTVDKTTPK
jgi:hypothetical protein